MKALNIIFGLFAGSVVLVNATATNVINVGPFTLVAATLLYPITFLLTDVVSEVYGADDARRMIWCGFATQLMAVAFVQIASAFPSVDPEVAAAWQEIFQPMLRVALGSMLAYIVAQLVDVRIFHYLRSLTEGRHLWLRNNASTLVSQAIDTVIFMTIAFGFTLSWAELGTLIFSVYVFKAIVAFFDTPLCYLAVAAARRLPTEK